MCRNDGNVVDSKLYIYGILFNVMHVEIEILFVGGRQIEGQLEVYEHAA
jgi:hypothetical protein